MGCADLLQQLAFLFSEIDEQLGHGKTSDKKQLFAGSL